jgi:hypothetical protein
MRRKKRLEADKCCMPEAGVISRADFMILRLTTSHENENSALSPLGERVARDGAFISRRGPGEGVLEMRVPSIFMAVPHASSGTQEP